MTGIGSNLTKFSLSLIIIVGQARGVTSGRGRPGLAHTQKGRCNNMRVTIYKWTEGQFALLFQPALGKGLPPITVPAMSKESLKARVLTELTAFALLDKAIHATP